MSRERKGRPAQAPIAVPPALVASPSRPAPRMIVVAGMGRDGGLAALRAAAQWAVLLARRVALSECFASADNGDSMAPAGTSDLVLPRVRVCCAPERLALMRADVVAAVLEQVRRHERSADLLLVRVPLGERLGLMRAVFLGRALVLPLDETTVGDAVELSRDVVQSFSDVTLWPYAEGSRLLRRFTEALRSELPGTRALPFDPSRLDLAPALESLPGPPEEGFLSAVLLPAAAGVPPELLRFDSLPLS